jgi:hypothetical protein
MSRERSLCFDALEERELLSRAHIAAHARPAAAATTLVLNGTLTVDNKAATTTMDESGDTMTATPVAGQLGSLGEVHGTWNEAADEYGDYMGPDTIQLRNASGSITIAFNEQKTGPRHRVTGGGVEYGVPLLASGGTGAYAGARASGTLELTTNSGRTAVQSMTVTG